MSSAGDQVRAADAAQGAALGDEALPDLGVQAVVLSQDLDGHGGVESLVVCAVHRGEGADTEHLVQPVVAQQLCHQSFSGAGLVRAQPAGEHRAAPADL